MRPGHCWRDVRALPLVRGLGDAYSHAWRKIDKPLSDQITNTEAANRGGLARPGLVRF
jgi:hypothetical protein